MSIIVTIEFNNLIYYVCLAFLQYTKYYNIVLHITIYLFIANLGNSTNNPLKTYYADNLLKIKENYKTKAGEVTLMQFNLV